MTKLIWLRAALGLEHLKLGLEGFVTEQINRSHSQLRLDVANSMGVSSPSDIDCSGQTLIKNVSHFRPPVFNCEIHSTRDMCISLKCPNASCDVLLKEIAKLHRRHNPVWNNTTINPSQWICNPWEFAKCFLSTSGNQSKTSIKELDCAGILSIMINLFPIARSLKIDDNDIKSENDVLSRVYILIATKSLI